MKPKEEILCVDDESHVLEGLQRVLFRSYTVRVANSGAAGLEALAKKEAPVVISDMRMPGMDGATFLSRVQEKYPSTVRILLTGQSDLTAAANAVNHGGIYRFLLKPCDQSTLSRAIEDALAQHRLLRVEKDLLDRTLGGAVDALIKLLEAVAPHLQKENLAYCRIVDAILETEPVQERWACETAAKLAYIGHVTIPESSLEKKPETLKTMEESARTLAAEMLEAIPRLEGVAALVRAIDQPSSRSPAERVMQTAHRFLTLARNGLDSQRAAAQASDNTAIQSRLAGLEPEIVGKQYRDLPLSKLRVRMVIGEDIKTVAGAVIARSGHVITAPLLRRLENFDTQTGLVQPIRVLTGTSQGVD
ncbi:MAG: response regulator [Myxococcota bacterium]